MTIRQRRSLVHNLRERGTRKPNMAARVWNKYHGNAPVNAVYIGRGSPWGNPFKIGEHGTREEVIQKFEASLLPVHKQLIQQELRGKHLLCFCAPKACHGDVLLRIANEADHETLPHRASQPAA